MDKTTEIQDDNGLGKIAKVFYNDYNESALLKK